jgi:hypothetical protein
LKKFGHAKTQRIGLCALLDSGLPYRRRDPNRQQQTSAEGAEVMAKFSQKYVHPQTCSEGAVDNGSANRWGLAHSVKKGFSMGGALDYLHTNTCYASAMTVM